MRGLLSLVVVLVLTVCAGAGPALAGKGSSSAPPYAEIQAAVYEILARDERLPLPLERIRDALMAHYIRDEGTIYWVGTGRMTPFLQRLADAESDGLNPADYPIDAPDRAARLDRARRRLSPPPRPSSISRPSSWPMRPT